jgi:hypothetical protein
MLGMRVVIENLTGERETIWSCTGTNCAQYLEEPSFVEYMKREIGNRSYVIECLLKNEDDGLLVWRESLHSL